MALQCPKCDLRFDLKPMLADHLATDHDAAAEEVVGLKPEAARIGFKPVERDRGEPRDKH